MYQENNQTIPLEKYIQALKSVYKKHIQFGYLALLLIFGVVFAIIYITFNPSINFFMYAIVGILIIIGLEGFSTSTTYDAIDKVEKTMQIYTLDEFKHAFRKAFKQQYINNIKIYIPIYILIIGILTYMFVTYYTENTWFIIMLAIVMIYLLIALFTTTNYILNEFFKIVEEEAEMKAILL